jgi:hypothetical protein
MSASVVDDRYMARVYLAQARVNRHRPAWHATLLRWAASRRLASMKPKQQPELF